MLRNKIPDIILKKSKKDCAYIKANNVHFLHASLVHFGKTAAVAQWVKAFASQAEGWVIESQLRQTYVAKTGSDISTAKRSKIGVNVMDPRR